MPKHRWSLLCRRAIVDKYTNVLSILEVLDEAVIEGPVDAPPEDAAIVVDVQLVTIWARRDPATPESFVQAVTVTLPNGEIRDAGARIEGNLEQHQRTRLIVHVRGLAYAGTGEYSFNIHLEKKGGGVGKIIDSVPFLLKAKEKDEATSST